MVYSQTCFKASKGQTHTVQLYINPLSPNIHKQILQTDLYTFLLRISWENLRKDQRIFSFSDHLSNSHNLISWHCMDIVTRNLMLVTIGTLRVKGVYMWTVVHWIVQLHLLGGTNFKDNACWWGIHFRKPFTNTLFTNEIYCTFCLYLWETVCSFEWVLVESHDRMLNLYSL